jgi:hypothetical protein
MTKANIRGVAAGVAALAALAIPASAAADTGNASSEPSIVSSLNGPAVLDGKTYSAKQMKQRFAGQPLFFVLGSREEARGAVAAFRTRAEARSYLDRTGRRRPAHGNKARASYNGYESVFYEDSFLEGNSITIPAGGAIGNLADHCKNWTLWWCNTTWDNQISSAKTGYWGARLFNWQYLNYSGGWVDIPGSDSVELGRFFNDVTSSIKVFP